MTVRRGLSALAVLVVVALGFAGWWWTGRASIVETVDATVLVSERTTAVADTQVAGYLTTRDGCLSVGQYVVVWPHGTEVVDEDPLTIEVPGVGRLSIGDAAHLPGEYVHDASGHTSRPGLEVGGVLVPEVCTYNGIALTQSG